MKLRSGNAARSTGGRGLRQAAALVLAVSALAACGDAGDVAGKLGEDLSSFGVEINVSPEQFMEQMKQTCGLDDGALKVFVDSQADSGTVLDAARIGVMNVCPERLEKFDELAAAARQAH